MSKQILSKCYRDWSSRYEVLEKSLKKRKRFHPKMLFLKVDKKNSSTYLWIKNNYASKGGGGCVSIGIFLIQYKKSMPSIQSLWNWKTKKWGFCSVGREHLKAHRARKLPKKSSKVISSLVIFICNKTSVNLRIVKLSKQDTCQNLCI